jgi:hypothetical protein
MGADVSVDDGCERSLCAGGGVGPPRTTVLMKPDDCKAKASWRWNLLSGIEVRDRRALLAFWRWEAACARWTSETIFLMEGRPKPGLM